MTTIAQHRAAMPTGTNPVIDRETLENGNEYLIPFLRPGISVLDVGCGSGAITRGIAERVYPGKVVGLDSSDDLIRQGIARHSGIKNLSLEAGNIFEYTTSEKFDVVTSARTLQWLSNPVDALKKMKMHLKAGGLIFILDYNHEKIEWNPTLPASMDRFYSTFLTWRKDAGMNNAIADDLADMLSANGFVHIGSEDANESAGRGDAHFSEVAGIWKTVAEKRGPQIVNDGYLTEDERIAAIEDFQNWLTHDGQSVKMHLRAVHGYNEYARP